MYFTKNACRIILRRASFFVPFVLPSFVFAQEPQAPAIRVEVSRVNVGVIATDRRGKFVEGLQKSDFHIFDNGVEQPIAGFLANDDPAQVILLLECGPSVSLFGSEYVQRSDALIANLAPNDRVAIVCYSSAPAVQFELSDDKGSARLERLKDEAVNVNRSHHAGPFKQAGDIMTTAAARMEAFPPGCAPSGPH